MKKAQFIQEALKAGIKIYELKKVKKGENAGYKIEYANKINETTVTTQKQIEFWNRDFNQIASEWFCN